jgi:hypothetical protein
VFGVHAVADAAEVVDFTILRNWTDDEFVRHAVRVNIPAVFI